MEAIRILHRDSDKNNESGRGDPGIYKVVLESPLRHHISAQSTKYVMYCNSRQGNRSFREVWQDCPSSEHYRCQ